MRRGDGQTSFPREDPELGPQAGSEEEIPRQTALLSTGSDTLKPQREGWARAGRKMDRKLSLTESTFASSRRPGWT